MKNQFSHTDTLKIFPNVKVRTLISWSERGLIKPLQDASGRGSARAYSYTNLIEIGIINELLQYGIPFTNIQLSMRSANMKNLLKNKAWDMIFWISNGTTGRFDKSIPVLYSGVLPVNEFMRKGGRILTSQGQAFSETSDHSAAIKETEPFIFKFSTIVINVSSLKSYVDYMIKKL